MTRRPPHERPCGLLDPGAIDLYFYGELDYAGRDDVERHLAGCRHCREALDELVTIRDALAARPVVSAPAGGDWSGFMARLDRAISQEATGSGGVLRFAPRPVSRRASVVPWLTMAALLALVTMSVIFAARAGGGAGRVPAAAHARPASAQPDAAGAMAPAPADTSSLAAIGTQHLERSKLVLLGLANKEAGEAGDWEFERELASRLLTDTRMYRMAAEERGLDRLAGIMRDLELVLLQASMTDQASPEALSQIQRAIRKRDLLQKMDMVRTSTGT